MSVKPDPSGLHHPFKIRLSSLCDVTAPSFQAIEQDRPIPVDVGDDFIVAHAVATHDMIKYPFLYPKPDSNLSYESRTASWVFAPLVRTCPTSPLGGFIPPADDDEDVDDVLLARCQPLVLAKSNKLVADVVLHERIYDTGRTWHVYRAEATLPDQSVHRIVVKLMAPRLVISFRKLETATNAISRAVDEDIIYRTRLREHGLEHDTVAKHYGLFVTEGASKTPDTAQLVVALVEDVGNVIEDWHGPLWDIPEGYAHTMENRLRAVYERGKLFYGGSRYRTQIFAQPPFNLEHADTVRVACFGRWVMAHMPSVNLGKPSAGLKIPQSQLDRVAMITDLANPRKEEWRIRADHQMKVLAAKADAYREERIRAGTYTARQPLIAASTYLADVEWAERAQLLSMPAASVAATARPPTAMPVTPDPSRMLHSRQLAIFDGVSLPDGSIRMFSPEEALAIATARRDRLREAGVDMGARLAPVHGLDALVAANIELFKATSSDDYQRRLQEHRASMVAELDTSDAAPSRPPTRPPTPPVGV